MGRPKMPPMWQPKPTKAPATDSSFESFVENNDRQVFNKTNDDKNSLEPDIHGDTEYNDNDFYDSYDKPVAAKPSPMPKDPYEDGKEMSGEMKTYWNHLIHDTTPLYDNDDYNYDKGSPYQAYDEYTIDLPPNGTRDDYLYSPYQRQRTPYYTGPNNTLIARESVSYPVTSYEIMHAVYMGAVVLILAANLVMIIAILLQKKLRCRPSTVLLVNFFFIEVFLSVVDLIFTQNLLLTQESDKGNMGLVLCQAGPWLLHILQAAQPVALFVLNVDSITTILAPEKHETRVGCRICAILILVTWLFGIALASIFVTRSELIETLAVKILCYDSYGNGEPLTMHFLMGLLQLGGPIVVLLVSGITLGAVVIRKRSSQRNPLAKSYTRASVIILLAVSVTYVLVTLPVIIVNALFVYYAIPKSTKAWITVQVIRRIGALFFPAFWWSRPDVRYSLKQLPSRLLCRVQSATPRASVICLENDTETADLLPLELTDPKETAEETYRAV